MIENNIFNKFNWIVNNINKNNDSNNNCVITSTTNNNNDKNNINLDNNSDYINIKIKLI